jgi:hypothetical protein
MQPHQLFVHAQSRTARRESQANSRISTHGIRYDSRRFAAQLFGVGFEHQQHR